MIWYSFLPTDTLFFKSAVQAEKGLNHEALSIFPPSPQTVLGALRTTILRQNGISISDYKQGALSQDLAEAVGKPGSQAPFNLVGPMVQKGNQLFLPTPYHWFVSKDTKSEETDFEKVFIAVQESSNLLQYPQDKKYWVKGSDSELENVGGRWIATEKFNQPTRHDLLKNEQFFLPEIRTGNALTTSRNVHTGHLYSFAHIRMRNSCRLVFAVDRELPLSDQGVLTLGGEQRFGAYTRAEQVRLPQGTSGLFMNLTLLEADDESQEHLVATGKLVYRGGWDLHIGFHKPMQAYYPAGSVFEKKLNDNMIEL